MQKGAGDERLLRSATLRLEDLPSGWTSDGDAEATEARCVSLKALRKSKVASRGTPAFSEGPGLPQLSEVIYSYSSSDQANGLLDDVLTNETCIAEQLAKNVESGIEGADASEPTVADLRVSDVGSRSEAIQVTIPLALNGAESSIVVQVVFVRQGRSLAIINFIDEATAFDVDLRERLTATAVTRLQRALER